MFVCCECFELPLSLFIPFLSRPQCCYDNPLWSLLHRSGPQCRHSGNLLALGRQHKIGIIAVDYGTQWAAASERFIHPGKRDCVGGEGEKKEKKTGALVPPLLSHGGHRHDISGLKERAFWTYPLPPVLPFYPSLFQPTPPPPFFSFLGSASLDAALGQASWGHCHCLHAKQSPSEGKERKRRASHGTSQEQGWLPLPTPSKAPLLPEKYWCDLCTPFSPSVPRTPPL